MFLRHLKTFEKLTAYFDIFLVDEEYNITVTEDEIDSANKHDFEIYWNPDFGGYMFDGDVMKLNIFLEEYRDAVKVVGEDGFDEIRKYNL